MRIHDLVFLLSGAASLVYQVVWLRLAGRALGSDALGAALVLSGFMGGMALGAGLPALGGLGQRLRSSRSPERIYAGLLALTAAWAVASPLGFAAIEHLPGFWTRAAATLALLLPPTLAMGASFPLMGRLTIADARTAGAETGGFYGANTAGAALGALAAPFLILPALGFSRGLWAGAACDLAAAGLALLTLGGHTPAPPEPSAEPALGVPARRGVLARLTLGTALMGASALAFEVLLTRILAGLTGSSIHAYGILLFVFLTGLALGARQAQAWLSKGRSALHLYALCAAAAAPLAFGGLLLLDLRIGDAAALGGLRNLATTAGGTTKLWLAQALLAGIALLPPTLAFGAALPAAIGAAATAARTPTTNVLARLYAANTLGSAAGALAGGLLLARLGLAPALALSLGATALAALLVRLERRELRLARAGLLLAGLLLGALALRPPASAPELLAEYHSMVSTASVEERPSADPDAAPLRVLRVDGKVVAGTAPIDLRLQRLLGAIPLVLHGDVERALVVGLGTGMTAASLLPGEALQHLDVVELSPALPRAAAWFEPWQDGLFESPALHLRLADGRPFLSRSRERWDLITSDPIHPWTRGSSDLYALEHFERIAAALEPGGIASQWLPLYQLSTADVDTVLATWVAAFPRTAAYLTGYDLVLIGRLEGPVDLHRVLAERALDARLAARLAEAGVRGLAELAALQIADDAALRSRTASIAPMRLDTPSLEFSAPTSFLGGVSDEFLRWCVRPEQTGALPAALRPAADRNREALLEFLDAAGEADWKLRAARYGRRLMQR